MTLASVISEAKEIVEKVVPASIELTRIEFEGPVVVIYTRNIDVFADNQDLVRQLAQGLRRRVAIRPDPSLLISTEEAEKIIRGLIPKEAEITNIYFEPETGEVTIEALSPGLVIGKQGTILNEIKRRIGWVPKVVRAPPIPSKTVEEIRLYLRKVHNERQDFLHRTGRRISREPSPGEQYVRVTSLGGFRQVGRSAVLLTTRESKVLVDCGVDVGSVNNGGPYLNAPELMPLESLDAIVLTHAHLDHSGIVPTLYKYGYEGPIYCTPPTRDLASLLQIDYIKVAFGEGKKPPYESPQIRDAVKRTIPLKYSETTDIAPDIRLTLQNAGHILGSATAHFHIGDGLYNVAVTGDIKFERTWLFNPAVNRFPRLETLIMESTYGGYHDLQPSRQEAAKRLKAIVGSVLRRGGKVLAPVFAVGRSQEVMLVLEELMRKGEIPQVPVHLDGMIWEATAIHTAYPEYLNNQLRTQIFQTGENPFLSSIFERVDSSDKRINICDDPDPCVVLATSGMMNGGPVMEYFKAWADNPQHALLFVGFTAEGTLARRIQKERREITVNDKGTPLNLHVKMDLETIDGFSGHSDRLQLLNYVGSMEPRPERVLVCHGEEHKCLDLASSLYKKFGMETRAPMNLETVRLK
ncbi:MAG: beta-CASP ribonuclease aCPSF1 [Candidatus Thermoplasmatota archaeon]|nr:beta-CASP ribonuclease aCPSF1 [Candidatus Thermoplasmatota archaeon]